MFDHRSVFNGRFAGKLLSIDVTQEVDDWDRVDHGGRIGRRMYSREPITTLTISGRLDMSDVEDMLLLLDALSPQRAQTTSDGVASSYRSEPGPPGLPAPRKRPWREVLGDLKTRADVRKRWRELVYQSHPDRGGRHEVIVEINQARDEALMELL